MLQWQSHIYISLACALNAVCRKSLIGETVFSGSTLVPVLYCFHFDSVLQLVSCLLHWIGTFACSCSAAAESLSSRIFPLVSARRMRCSLSRHPSADFGMWFRCDKARRFYSSSSLSQCSCPHECTQSTKRHTGCNSTVRLSRAATYFHTHARKKKSSISY